MILQRFCVVFGLLIALAAAEAQESCIEEHDKSTLMQVNTRLSGLRSAGSELDEDHVTQANDGLNSEESIMQGQPSQSQVDLESGLGPDREQFPTPSRDPQEGLLVADGVELDEDAPTTRLSTEDQQERNLQSQSHMVTSQVLAEDPFQTTAVENKYSSLPLDAAGPEPKEDSAIADLTPVPDEYGSSAEPVPRHLRSAVSELNADALAQDEGPVMREQQFQTFGAKAGPSQTLGAKAVPDEHGSFEEPIMLVTQDSRVSHQLSAAEAMGVAGQSVQAASQSLDNAQSLADEYVSRATAAEDSLKVLMQKGRAAKKSQTVALAQEEKLSETVLHAMERVRAASSKQQREATAELTASNYLETALEDAEQMQAQEKERGTQVMKVAELLQDAVGNLQRQAEENPDSATVHSLKAALQAQQAVALTESKKLQNAAFLQQSLRNAATAVLTVKGAKDELQDVYKQLRGVQAAWDERTLWEMESTKLLEGVLNDTISVQEVVEGVLANRTSKASLLQEVAQKMRTVAHATQGLEKEKLASQAQMESMREGLVAEKQASQEALKAEKQAASLMRDAFVAKEQAIIQEASSKLQASEAQVQQLWHHLQNAQQELSSRSTHAAALSQVSRSLEVQLGNLGQQLSSFRSISQEPPPLQLPAISPQLQDSMPNLQGGILENVQPVPAAAFGLQSPGEAVVPAPSFLRDMGRFSDVPLARP